MDSFGDVMFGRNDNPFFRNHWDQVKHYLDDK